MKEVAKEVASELAHFKMPVTAAATVALVVQYFPSINPSAQLVTGILIVVGVAASFAQKILDKKTEAKEEGKPPPAKKK